MLGVILTGLAYLAALMLWAKNQQLGQEVQVWRLSIVQVALIGFLTNLSVHFWIYWVFLAGFAFVVGCIELVACKECDWFRIAGTVMVAAILGYVLPMAVLVLQPAPWHTALWWVVPCLVLSYTWLGNPVRKVAGRLGWI